MGARKVMTVIAVLHFLTRLVVQVTCVVFMIFCIPVYACFVVHKCLVWLHLKLCFDRNVEFMSGQDGFWGLDFIDLPNNHVHVNALMFLNGKPNYAEMARVVNDRLVNAKDASGKLRFRKLQQYILRKHGFVLWRNEDEFKIEDHFGVLEENGEVVHYRSDSHLRRLVTEQSRVPFKQNRSPWKITIIPEFVSSATDKPGDNGVRSYVLYIKVHHCIADGVSLVRVFLENLADNPEDIVLPVKPKRSSRWERALFRIQSFINIPFSLAHLVLRPDVNPLKVSEMTGQKLFAWSQPVSLNVLKKIKEATGTTLNDVVTSCVTGAVNRFIAEAAAKDNFDAEYETGTRSFSVVIPVSLHDQDEQAVLLNRLSFFRLGLPLDLWDPMEQLRAISSACNDMKHSPDLASNYLCTQYVCNTMPSLLVKIIMKRTPGTLVFSNVPGPAKLIYLFGHPVTNSMFWVPQTGNIGTGISILSYSDSVTIGVVLDSGVVPNEEDADRLLRYILDEIQMLLSATDLDGLKHTLNKAKRG